MLERVPIPLRDLEVAEQFEDRVQQADAARLGVWIFLATEALFFGALLLAYTVLRQSYPEAFRQAGRETDVLIGTLNTAILLTSSYAMALAVRDTHGDERDLEPGARARTLRRLLVVLGLGTAFMGLKAFEYAEDFRKNLLPTSVRFPIVGVEELPGRLFYWLYYAMTGLHAFHLLIGLVLVAGCYRRCRRGNGGPSRRANALRGVGLYWHFVDSVWVVLYPLLYLIDRSAR